MIKESHGTENLKVEIVEKKVNKIFAEREC